MTDKKTPQKDLTGILQYAKQMQDAGQAPEPPQGSIMEETPLEKISDFESLEAYSAANPAPDPAIDPIFEPEPNSNPTLPSPTQSTDPAQSESQPFESDFQTTPSDPLPEEPNPFETTPPVELQNQGAQEPGNENQDLPLLDEFKTTPPASEGFHAIENESPPETRDFPHPNELIKPAPPKPSPPSEKITFKKDSPTPPPSTLESVKKYSEQLPTTRSAVPASFPFSVLIQGQLRPEEKEKLLSLIEDQQMGFRPIDLEPQLASNRILIPRISEYAAIVIIQALRGTRAQMKMGPSDTIFSTADTQDTEEETFSSTREENSATYSSELSHPAEALPVTPLDHLPGSPQLVLIDTITANAAMKSTVVEAEHSSAFQEIIEALQREVKYKAYRKGATAVINFKIQVNYLSSPTHYRILAMGSAVRDVMKEHQPNPNGPSH